MDKMCALRQAKTWEISESEDETEAENKSSPDSKCQEILPCMTMITDCKEEKDEKDASSDHKVQTPPSPPAALNRYSRKTCTLPPPPKPAAHSGTPSPTRKRRTKEEIEVDKQKAKERKEARERTRTAKEKEKEEKKVEQQRRREAAAHLKTLRPENCLKSLTVCIDPVLLQQEGSDILLERLSSLEWTFIIEAQKLTHSITWTRQLPQEGETVDEEQVLMVIGWSDFLDLVSAVKKMLDNEGGEAGGTSFLSPLLEFLNREAKKVVTTLVTGSPLEYTGSFSEDSDEETLASNLGMSQLEMEEVLVYLQLYKNVSLVFLDSWQSVTDHVSAVTKALSKRPYKLLTERAELPFCVDGSWASGARVERDGSGLHQVWTLQIQQLNRVSPAVAATVTEAYQSPQLLLQEYQRLEADEERKSLLSGLLIRTGGKERRVGPDISSRVYRCLTSQNPQLVLD